MSAPERERENAACKHGVEAGNFCAKCGKEIVRGPVVDSPAASTWVCSQCGGTFPIDSGHICAPPGKPSAARSTRFPTEHQYRVLLSLGSGNAGLSRTKRQTDPLLRHGWVTADWRPPYYQFVRITADGMRALAAAIERFGLPDLTRGVVERKVCSECGCEWRPSCKCGSRSYRFDFEEVERDAA